MLTLRALADNDEQALPCLGNLRPLEDEPSRGVRLTKKIAVRDIGTYKKCLITPLYRAASLNSLALTIPGWKFDPTHCVGVLCTSVSIAPMGYVTRQSGLHHFCLPVYRPDSLSGSFYRVAGYMATDTGFLAVAKRRTLLWVLLGLLSGTTFVLSYLMLRYGVEDALPELLRFFRELPQVLGGLWP